MHDLCTAASRGMADGLRSNFEKRVPLTIYNAFPWTDRASIDGKRIDRNGSKVISFNWYSQTIGPNRGLEAALAALELLEIPCQLHIRGRKTPESVHATDYCLPVLLPLSGEKE